MDRIINRLYAHLLVNQTSLLRLFFQALREKAVGGTPCFCVGGPTQKKETLQELPILQLLKRSHSSNCEAKGKALARAHNNHQHRVDNCNTEIACKLVLQMTNFLKQSIIISKEKLDFD